MNGKMLLLLDHAGEDGPIENARRWLCEEQTDEVSASIIWHPRFALNRGRCWLHSVSLFLSVGYAGV